MPPRKDSHSPGLCSVCRTEWEHTQLQGGVWGEGTSVGIRIRGEWIGGGLGEFEEFSDGWICFSLLPSLVLSHSSTETLV